MRPEGKSLDEKEEAVALRLAAVSSGNLNPMAAVFGATPTTFPLSMPPLPVPRAVQWCSVYLHAHVRRF